MSEHIVESEQRVTPLELFFDLVFVFAFTQVTTLLLDHVSWGGLGRGLLVLAVLWWAWASYAWLTNTVDAEAGPVMAVILVAIGAMFVAALRSRKRSEVTASSLRWRSWSSWRRSSGCSRWPVGTSPIFSPPSCGCRARPFSAARSSSGQRSSAADFGRHSGSRRWRSASSHRGCAVCGAGGCSRPISPSATA